MNGKSRIVHFLYLTSSVKYAAEIYGVRTAQRTKVVFWQDGFCDLVELETLTNFTVGASEK